MALPSRFRNVSTEFTLKSDTQPGRVLLLDGDGLCYHAAHKSAKLSTAIQKVHQEVLTKLFLTKAEIARVHLTARGNKKALRGSIRAAKPYQGNRKGKPKPALLEPLREALEARGGLPEADFILHHDVEADDAMIMEAYRLKHHGVICSEDKDLRQTVYPYYDSSEDTLDGGASPGWVGLKTLERSGTQKLTGRGLEFFWAQMLCGDSADNVQGIKALEGKPCGAVRAVEVLQGHTELEMAEIVLQAYGKIRQNAVAEAWLLFLLRHPRDNVLKYFQELELCNSTRDLIEEWQAEDWFDE